MNRAQDNQLEVCPSLLEQRAREKQASRDEDDRALASGEKSMEQLRRENGAFSFPQHRIRILTFR